VDSDNRVRIEVSLSDGLIKVDADASQIDGIFDRLESFLARAEQPDRFRVSDERRNDESEVGPLDVSGAVQVEASEEKPKRKRGKASKNPPKYKMIDLGLKGDGMESLRTPFAQRKPGNQNQQVAVLVVSIHEITGKTEFDVNAVYSGLKIVGSPIPKNLVSVFANMKADGICAGERGKIQVNHLVEDYVAHRMMTGKDDQPAD